ncbi:hypothetical protein MA16_Dca027409 [Dendrobium catenatum]|uniref:DUF4283 domain-containing protein n=1 Tax=Dendrobium catenatum TaxID=906689 RepID=A0A2I0WZ31_9ASPA|nr:hypothetical protein MA16_Dca027409 [Dendrobium catenatum]
MTKVMNGSSRQMLSPPAFGDGNNGVVLINKTMNNKGIVIKEGGLSARIEPEIIGKGKGKLIEEEVGEFLKRRVDLKPYDGSEGSPSILALKMNSPSSSGIKNNNDVVILDRFKSVNPDLSNFEASKRKNESKSPNVKGGTGKMLFSNLFNVKEVDSAEQGIGGDNIPNSKDNLEGEKNKLWRKKENIKVSDLQLGEFLAEDGKTVKLHEDNEKENSDRLCNSIVIKVFGGDPPLKTISYELRRQWMQFGKFHLTMLGMGWVLCSFYEPEHMEAVMTNGPWFVNGKIIGMDNWSQNFSTNSLKGLTAPIWIRLPNLPLQCWDNINLCRIASMVGKPYLIDGNMFQWGRREFGRVCVRIQLDNKLPLGV